MRSPHEPKSRITEDALITSLVSREQLAYDGEKLRRIYDKVCGIEEQHYARHSQVITMLQAMSKDFSNILSLSASHTNCSSAQESVHTSSVKVWLDEVKSRAQPDAMAELDTDQPQPDPRLVSSASTRSTAAEDEAAKETANATAGMTVDAAVDVPYDAATAQEARAIEGEEKTLVVTDRSMTPIDVDGEHPRKEYPDLQLNVDDEKRASNKSRASQDGKKRESSKSHASQKNIRVSSFLPPINKHAWEAWNLEKSASDILIPPWRDGVVPFLSALSSRCILWFYFDYFIGVVILFNSICIGWEANEEIGINNGPPAFVAGLELIFMCIYMVELLLRFMADGWRESVAKVWVRFDIFLVGLGTISMVIVEPLRGSIDADSGSSSQTVIDSLDTIMILRILRLLRLLRVLRLFEQFKTLWRLVQGLMMSTSAMLSTLALLFCVIYLFACIGVEIITKSTYMSEHPDQQIRDIVTNKFSDLPGIMLTLTQFVTMDSLATIYTPIIKEQWWMVFYFLPIILVIPVALMNLVTAVLVEAAMELATEDEEMAKRYRKAYLQQIAPEIHEAFRLVDQDGSGFISRDEVVSAKDNLPTVLSENIQGDQVADFFEMLDVDGSGEISEVEFVEGVLSYLLSDVSVETQQSLKILRMVKEKVTLLEEVVFKLPGAPPQKSAHTRHKKSQVSISAVVAAMSSRKKKNRRTSSANGVSSR